jgi:hypothetical protein
MFRKALLPAVAAALLCSSLPAAAQSTGVMGDNGAKVGNSIFNGIKGGPDHGMPVGIAGGDGVMYDGAPDLQATSSLIAAGGDPGNFSLVKALTAMAGDTIANAEVAKLNKQYGEARVNSFVTVQNFAVNDAVKLATAAGVKLPAPTLQGADLAKRVVGLGLVDGTYYEGTQLDHLVTSKIHGEVMADIDAKFGSMADANYHLIANQAHYDLAQALGVTSVKLADYH